MLQITDVKKDKRSPRIGQLINKVLSDYFIVDHDQYSRPQLI